MTWCHQATSHYLSQCSPRSLLPYVITRPQWFNFLYSELSRLDNIYIYSQNSHCIFGSFGWSVAQCCSKKISHLDLNLGHIHNLVTHLSFYAVDFKAGMHLINSSPPGQNGRYFADIFKRIFENENLSIFIRFSLKFLPKATVDNMPALVQVITWRRTGDKPLPEPMLTQFTDACMQH